jgi:general secretion pathway protein M
MSAGALAWWRGRTAREQWLLAIMGLLLVALLAWLLVARPLAAALETAHAREAAAAEALGEARARAARFAARDGAMAASAPLPIDSLIARTAADAGFASARVTAQGPTRATLTVEAARPRALFAWITDLEARGIVVETLRATAGADHDVAVEARLRARGSR